MRILKKKLEMAKQRKEMAIQGSIYEKIEKTKIEQKEDNYLLYQSQSTTTNESLKSLDSPVSITSLQKDLGSAKKCTFSNSNNIMKNYCRAIGNFALSSTVDSYLNPLLEKHQISQKSFKAFIQSRKGKMNCIKQLRQCLLPMKNDSEDVIVMRRIFQEITIIFLKFFVPNWLYNSKIADKWGHLKFRFRILRRVKDPIHFTYLQGFSSPN